MGQVLHGSATTTGASQRLAIRSGFQPSAGIVKFPATLEPQRNPKEKFD